MSTHLSELRQPRKSIWGPNSFHKREYHRRSVEKDIKKFIGWPKMRRIVDAVRQVDLHPPRQKRNVSFVSCLFNTGGRVTEVLALVRENFTFTSALDPKTGDRLPVVIVSDMLLEKRYEKVGEFVECVSERGGCGFDNTRGTNICEGCGQILLQTGQRRFITKSETDMTRNDFVIRLDEPLSNFMVEWIKECESGLLFPSPYCLGPLSRQWAYALVRQAGELLDLHLYDHWFRGQRASQLNSDYRASEVVLLEWFSWQKWETAKKYVKLGPKGQAREMGVILE